MLYEAEVKRRKEGAGKKALQAPRNENVQSNRGKYRNRKKMLQAWNH